jgi:biopolymer transport protein ExbB
MKNIIDVLNAGDTVSHAIAIVLLILSVFTWVIFIYKYFYLLLLSKRIPQYIHNFWEQKDFDLAFSWLQNKDMQYTSKLVAAIPSTHHSSGYQNNIPFKQRLSKDLRIALHGIYSKLHIGHNFLATVGSTSPFVGLFGTVWGIYHALVNIAEQKQVSIEHIAGPVGEALIMTAFGLIVALPAVVAYNILSKKAKFIYQHLDGFAKDLMHSTDDITK